MIFLLYLLAKATIWAIKVTLICCVAALIVAAVGLRALGALAVMLLARRRRC